LFEILKGRAISRRIACRTQERAKQAEHHEGNH
jgi:hypothetical protein